MQNYILEKTYNIASNYFHKWYGLVASSFLTITIALCFYKLIPDDKIRFLWYTYGIIGLEACLFLFWLFYTFCCIITE